ncbi:MAG: hypothetical protein ACM31C_12045 [Acidobacteriota bacterium]
MRLAAFACLAACSTSPAPDHPGAPQLHDLSILFPLDDRAQLADYLPASALVPETIYDQDFNTSQIPFDELHVVSFRLDPCFAQIGPVTDDAACKNQLRVVLQPLSFFQGQLLADDSAVHVFYSLTRDELLAAVADIVAAREHAGGSADLGALAPHPLIVRDGMDGELAQRLEQVITTYATTDRLVRFTSMLSANVFGGGTGEDRSWQLHGVDVAGDTTTSIDIATLPAQTTDETVAASSVPLDANLDPATASSDSIALLASTNAASTASAEQRQAAFDAALRIENPSFHSPDTIDCASCHMAEPARDLVGAQLGLAADGNPNAFVADPSLDPSDLRSTTHVLAADGSLNIHAFSYRGKEPMINARVIHETAANLAYVTAIYGSY